MIILLMEVTNVDLINSVNNNLSKSIRFKYFRKGDQEQRL